ncbi:MAG: LCP family protein [Clostridiales bacterium]|jgi:LCP family protein required for cell wall assembly|nr:LCP family protein [Clostridiales bacterium]
MGANARANERRRGAARTFFTALIWAMLIFLALYMIAQAAYSRLKGGAEYDPGVARGIDSNLEPDGGIFPGLPGVPPGDAAGMVYCALLGVDGDGTRTDTMMVAGFNAAEKKLSIVSIPRDAKVVMPESRRETLRALGLWTPSDGVMKLTEVHHYAGGNGVAFVVKQLEEITGAAIKYYVKVDLEAFQLIVDKMGGVWFDVPVDMKYTDPYQNLYIDLKAGEQLLDGERAMQLVRFRRYPGGDDWTRMETQQKFLKAMAAKFIEDTDGLTKATTLLETVYKYLSTNADVSDALRYMGTLGGMTAADIELYTLPGKDARIGGKDYVILDEEGSAEILAEAFGAGYRDSAPDEIRLAVLNGGYTAGAAAKNSEYLEANGFPVDYIGDYEGAATARTRVFVSREGCGEDIAALFPGSVLIVDKDAAGEYDVVVVIGYGA